MTVQPQSAPVASDSTISLQHASPGAISVTQTSVAAVASPTLPAIGVPLLSTAEEPLSRARRLVVLVPDQDTDEPELAGRIWALASPLGLSVLFLGLCRSTEAEFRSRRRLATLGAMTRDDGVAVDTRIELSLDWVQAIHSLRRPGDVVICHVEQSMRRWWKRRPLSEMLVSALHMPVGVLSGFYTATPTESANPVGWLLSWAVPVAIIVGFFWLQVQISQLPRNWLQTTLLCLSILVEFALIGISDHLAQRL